MIEVTLFGSLVGTLASALSVILLLTALTSVGVLATTGLAAVRRLEAPARSEGMRAVVAAGPPGLPQGDPAPSPPLGGDRAARGVGIAAAAVALLAAFFGLRVSRVDAVILPTIAVSLAGAAAVGSVAACVWAFGMHLLSALLDVRVQRDVRTRLAHQQHVAQREQQNRSHFEGWDLRAEVAQAGAALSRLRVALDALLQTRGALEQKLDASEPLADGDLVGAIGRARDDVATKIELAQRVLAAAEEAAFRLACNEPLRWLTRRRPREAMLVLTSPGGGSGPEIEERTGRASAALEGFLVELREARGWLAGLDAQRPASLPAGREHDPLDRIRRELDVMETAYGAVLQRLQVMRLENATRAGALEITTAAGAVSGAARASELTQGEIVTLVTEIARAESAMAIAAPDSDSRALTEALARVAIALDRSDAASLEELCAAFRAMR